MRAFRHPPAKSQRTRLERLRHGFVLALFALFCQSAVAILPMGIVAQSRDGETICTIQQVGTPAAHQSGKSAPHSMAACPVCQAAQLATNLLPSTPLGILVAPALASAHPPATDAPSLVDFSFRPQQARGPPLSV